MKATDLLAIAKTASQDAEEPLSKRPHAADEDAARLNRRQSRQIAQLAEHMAGMRRGKE